MKDYKLLTRFAGFGDKHRIRVSGEGAHTVVLGNGFGTDQDFWREVAAWLEPRFRVVRFDWAIDPVHFDASRYAAMDSYAEDLLAVIHATDAAPCTLVGHSMSGMVGMIAAKTVPAAFRHLVMIAPAPCYISGEGYPAGFTREEVDGLLNFMGENYMAWVEAFAPIAVGDPGNAAAIGEFSRSLTAMRPDVALSMAQRIFKMDLRGQLDGFSTATTIIQPDADPAVPVAVGEYLAKRWPQARLKVIEAAGHFPHLTASDQVIAVLDQVLGA